MNQKFAYVLLAMLCGLMFFFSLGKTPVMFFDEGLYSECSREMLASGDYVVPRVDGEHFFDKPPLCYWAQAGSMRLLGVNALGAQLPSALAALLMVGWTVFLGAKLFGKKAGVFAGFALASSMLCVAVAHMGIMDNVFSLMISLALGAFLLSYLEIWPRWGYVGAWAAIALASLIKGPAGIVLILASAGLFLILRRDFRGILRATPVWGIIVFLAIALPWYFLVHKATGGAFTQEFLLHQNLQRAMGKDFGHNWPFFVYIPLFLVLFFPWSIYCLRAWKSHVKLRPADDDKTGQAALFAGVWLVMIIGLFSLAVSKLMGYILPAFPAAALLVGLLWSRVIDGKKTGSLRSPAIWSFGVATFLAVVFVVGPRFLPRPIPGLSSALIPMSACMFAGPAIALVMIYRNRAGAAFAASCAGISGFLLFAVWLGLPIASRSMAEPMVAMSAKIKAEVPANASVVTINIHPLQPAFGFYAQRAVPDLYVVNDVKDQQKHPELKIKMNKDRSRLRAMLSEKVVYVVAQEKKLDGLPGGGKLEAQVSPYLLFKFEPQ